MTHSHTVHMYCGSIYNSGDRIIEKPALLLTKSDGCVHGFGDAEKITAKFVNMGVKYASAGFKDMAEDLMLLDFSNAYYKGMSNEEICYVLRRATEFTATGFQTDLVEHALKPDFQEWLRAEMKRFPIDLEEKEWK